MKTKVLRFIPALLLLAVSSCAQNPSVSSISSSSSESSSSISSEEESSSSLSSSEDSTSSLTSLDSGTSNSTSKSSSSPSSSSSEYFSLPENDERWPLDFSEYGQAFRNRLASLIRNSGSKTVSYSKVGNVLAYSDAALNGNGVIPFYHPDTDSTYSWNKEHVWPSSRGAGESGLGSDPQMLRPTNTSDNGDRHNYFYGDADLDNAGNTFDPATFGYEACRGECARIIFYCATRYYDTCGSGGSSKGNTPVSLSNNPADATGAHTMGRLDRLIEWNNQYPVTAQEIRRNNYLDEEGYARNPFIDHPEYANWIWNKNGLRTSPVNTDEITTIGSMSEVTYQYNYSPATSAAAFNNKVGIAGRTSSTSLYYAMLDEPLTETLSYYIEGQELVYENSQFKTDALDVALFNIEEAEDGHYTIRAGSKYLYNYIEGTYYSITFDPIDIVGISAFWDITFNSDGSVIICGATNKVYLEYYKKANASTGNFCGYNRAPNQSLILFQ